MCSYPTQVGHFWRRWMRRRYLTRKLDPGDRHIRLARPIAKHTSVLRGTSGSYSPGSAVTTSERSGCHNMKAPQQRLSGEFMSLTEEQSTALTASLDGKRHFQLSVLVKVWFEVIGGDRHSLSNHHLGFWKCLSLFKQLVVLVEPFQMIWCVRLEKPEDNQRLAHSCSPVGEALLFSSPWAFGKCHPESKTL